MRISWVYHPLMGGSAGVSAIVESLPIGVAKRGMSSHRILLSETAALAILGFSLARANVRDRFVRL